MPVSGLQFTKRHVRVELKEDRHEDPSSPRRASTPTPSTPAHYRPLSRATTPTPSSSARYLPLSRATTPTPTSPSRYLPLSRDAASTPSASSRYLPYSRATTPSPISPSRHSRATTPTPIASPPYISHSRATTPIPTPVSISSHHPLDRETTTAPISPSSHLPLSRPSSFSPRSLSHMDSPPSDSASLSSPRPYTPPVGASSAGEGSGGSWEVRTPGSGHSRLPSTDSGIQADAGWDSLTRSPRGKVMGDSGSPPDSRNTLKALTRWLKEPECGRQWVHQRMTADYINSLGSPKTSDVTSVRSTSHRASDVHRDVMTSSLDGGLTSKAGTTSSNVRTINVKVLGQQAPEKDVSARDGITRPSGAGESAEGHSYPSRMTRSTPEMGGGGGGMGPTALRIKRLEGLISGSQAGAGPARYFSSGTAQTSSPSASSPSSAATKLTSPRLFSSAVDRHSAEPPQSGSSSESTKGVCSTTSGISSSPATHSESGRGVRGNTSTASTTPLSLLTSSTPVTPSRTPLHVGGGGVKELFRQLSRGLSEEGASHVSHVRGPPVHLIHASQPLSPSVSGSSTPLPLTPRSEEGGGGVRREVGRGGTPIASTVPVQLAPRPKVTSVPVRVATSAGATTPGKEAREISVQVLKGGGGASVERVGENQGLKVSSDSSPKVSASIETPSTSTVKSQQVVVTTHTGQALSVSTSSSSVFSSPPPISSSTATAQTCLSTQPVSRPTVSPSSSHASTTLILPKVSQLPCPSSAGAGPHPETPVPSKTPPSTNAVCALKPRHVTPMFRSKLSPVLTRNMLRARVPVSVSIPAPPVLQPIPVQHVGTCRAHLKPSSAPSVQGQPIPVLHVQGARPSWTGPAPSSSLTPLPDRPPVLETPDVTERMASPVRDVIVVKTIPPEGVLRLLEHSAAVKEAKEREGDGGKEEERKVEVVDARKEVPWRERRRRMDTALNWLKAELEALRAMDTALMTQFQRCQETIESLKQQQHHAFAWGDGEGSEWGWGLDGSEFDEEEEAWEDWEIAEFERKWAEDPEARHIDITVLPAITDVTANSNVTASTDVTANGVTSAVSSSQREESPLKQDVEATV